MKIASLVKESPTCLVNQEFCRKLTIQECIKSNWDLSPFFLVAKPAVLPIIVLTRSEHQVVNMLLEKDNPYLINLLRDSLVEIENFIREKGLDGKINAVLEIEPEEPETRWVTIVLRTSFRDFKEQIFLWKNIERRIQKIVDGYLDRANEQDRTRIRIASALIATSVTSNE